MFYSKIHRLLIEYGHNFYLERKSAANRWVNGSVGDSDSLHDVDFALPGGKKKII